jgi:hypothetical protein
VELWIWRLPDEIAVSTIANVKSAPLVGVDSTPMAAVTPGRQRSERFINSLTGPTNGLRELGYADLQNRSALGHQTGRGELALLGIDVLDAFQTAAVVAAVAAMFASMGSVSAERSSNPPLVQHAMLAQEPGMHDLPLVAAAGLEIQERRPFVLELEIEFK